MLDYTSVDFPFTEFPKGLTSLYLTKSKENIHKINYAISYKGTNIIDLQGKVKISTEDGENLETEQLYFDQNEWFYRKKI
jgi:hypothetical protein